MTGCSVADCGRAHYARGLCNAHYVRRKRGQSLTEKSIYDMTATEKFSAKYERCPNGCWDWKHPRKDGRANTFKLRDKVMSAYRASYILHKGPIPDGMLVCHTCDNGRCVNPDHLWLGSYSDNNNDAIGKGRRVSTRQRGVSHSATNLTEDDVRAIRQEAASGKWGTITRLSKQFSVSKSTIQDIILRKTWRHVSS